MIMYGDPAPAAHQIIARAAQKCVPVFRAKQTVIAGAALTPIVARSSVYDVISALSEDNQVVARATKDRVVAISSVNADIVSTLVGNNIIAGRTDDAVHPRAGGNHIVSIAGMDC